MDPHTRRVLAAALGILVLAAAGLAVLDGGPARPGGPSVEGVVIAVDAAGLVDVRGFTLRTREGDQLDFSVRALKNGSAFPPAHLAEHVATSQSIRVWCERSPAGQLEAIWLEDAVPLSPPPSAT